MRDQGLDRRPVQRSHAPPEYRPRNYAEVDALIGRAMRIRVEPNVPDAWVVGAILVLGAGIVLAISALRLGAVEPRPASPLDAPIVAPTAMPAIGNATAAPTGASGIFEPGA